MSDVRINSIAIQRFVHDPSGPVALDLVKRGRLVKDIAYQNVSGDVLGVQSGNLRNHLEYLLEPAQDGITVIIGTTAINPETEFGYPRYYDRLASGEARPVTSFMPSRPWLRDALRRVFP